LTDAYDVYQHLMDYWAVVMQDDCYLIAADGWAAKTYRIQETDKKGKTKDKGWACDLVPKELIVARFFAIEKGELEKTQSELEAVSASLTELEEEHGMEDGVLGTLEKIAKAEINARLKEIKDDKETKEETTILNRWLKLAEQETALKRNAKEKDENLDNLALAKYPKLNETEIKALVIEEKWMKRLRSDLQGELERTSQTLTGRIRELSERYVVPLPQLEKELTTLSTRIEAHLKKIAP
jgi:type I restriction enzyme M protein